MTPGGAASDQSAGGVFCHRRFDRGKQSGPESLQAHQFARGADVLVAPAVRGGAARRVLPDAAGHLHCRSRRAQKAFDAVENIRIDPQESRILFRWIDSIKALDRNSHRRRPAQFSAESDLLRLLHRRVCFFSRRSPTCISCGRADCCMAWPPAQIGCFATKARTSISPSR